MATIENSVKSEWFSIDFKLLLSILGLITATHLEFYFHKTLIPNNAFSPHHVAECTP